jgi:hypothetical protein
MTDQALRAALLKLHAHSPLPASRFTPVQRSALDQFARQTGAVQCQSQGRGDVYCISDPVVFDAHARALSLRSRPRSTPRCRRARNTSPTPATARPGVISTTGITRCSRPWATR